MPEDLRRARGLLRDRKVRGARASDRDGSAPLVLERLAQEQQPRDGLVAGLQLSGQQRERFLRLVRVDARHQRRLAAGVNDLHDLGDLGRSFSWAVHDLGQTGAKVPVVIDSRKAQVLKRKGFQTLRGVIHGGFLLRDRLQKGAKSTGIHSFLGRFVDPASPAPKKTTGNVERGIEDNVRVKTLWKIIGLACLGGLLGSARPALARKKPVVAVLYFDNNTSDKALDVLQKGLADMMVTDLSQVEDLVVVERSKLQALLKELKLQRTRYFNKKTAVRIGRGLGARYAVTGAVAAVSPQMRLDVRLIDVKTSKVVVADKVVGPQDRFFELQSQLVNKFVQGLNLRFAFKPKIGRRVPNLKSLLQYSQGVDLADQGRLKEAEAKMKALVATAPTFGLARKKRAELAGALSGAQQRRVDAKGQAGDALQKKAQAYLRSKKLSQLDAKEAGVYLAYRSLLGQFLLRNLDLGLPGPSRLRIITAARASRGKKLVQAYIKNTDLMIEERDSLVSRHKNIRVSLSAEDRELADAIEFKTSVEHQVVNAELDLGTFLLLGKARYGDKRSLIVAPAPAELLRRSMKKTGFAMLERAEKRFAAKKLEHMVLLAVDAAAEAELLRGRTEAAIKHWQRFLNKYPTSKQFGRVEKKVQIALGMESDHSSRQLAAYERAISTCKSMDIRKGGKAMMDRRVRTEGMGAVDDVLKKLIKACKQNRKSKGAWKQFLGTIASYTGRHGDCKRFERYKKAHLRAGASARSQSKLHIRNQVGCKNIAKEWVPKPVCWSIDTEKSKFPFRTITGGLEKAGQATQPMDAWYTKDLWFKLVHPKQLKERSDQCRAVVLVEADGDRKKSRLTIRFAKGPKAGPLKLKLTSDKKAQTKVFEKIWRKYVWKKLSVR